MRVKLSDLPDVVAYADPASGKRGQELRRVRARMAIVVLAQDLLNRVFVLHAWADRCSTETFMDKIISVNADYHPRQFGIEANGMQTLFGDAVELRAREQNKRIPFVPVYQPTNVKKEWRIRTILQPRFANGLIFIQEHQIELQHEIEGFPNYPTVDLVDALASGCTLLPERQVKSRIADELNAMAEHLRLSGTPPREIERRIDELRREMEGAGGR